MKATDQDSALRVEMSALEDRADDSKARELHWKPMSWRGTLRPTTVDDAWAPAIWQTFFTSTLGRSPCPPLSRATTISLLLNTDVKSSS